VALLDLDQQVAVRRAVTGRVEHIGHLEELGYLEPRIDPHDVRSRRVYLTERGASTISVIRDAIAELERDWEARMGKADWDELKRLLVRLNVAVIDEPATDLR
jgi:DNA-binding MarR family transcriptional regulator